MPIVNCCSDLRIETQLTMSYSNFIFQKRIKARLDEKTNIQQTVLLPNVSTFNLNAQETISSMNLSITMAKCMSVSHHPYLISTRDNSFSPQTISLHT